MPEIVQENADQSETNRLNLKITTATIAGGTAGAAGMFGAGTWIRSKLRDFEFRVQDLTREDVLNRSAAAGIGAGLDSRGIEERHRLFLINTTEQNIPANASELAKLHVKNTTAGERKLAKALYNLGGKGGIELGIGAIAAAIVAIPVFIFGFRGNKSVASQQVVDTQVPSQQAAMTEPAKVAGLPAEAPSKQFAQDVKSNPIDPASVAIKSQTDVQTQR